MHLFTEHTNHGVVGAITQKGIRVILDDACNETTSCSGGCSSCGGKKPRRVVLVEREDAGCLRPGERVIVRHSTIHETAGALLVFGVPLFFAAGSMLIWHALQPATVESAAALLTAFCAFAAGFGVVRIVDALFQRRFPAAIVFPAAPNGSKDA
jgi:positive regulator of sigma E activity